VEDILEEDILVEDIPEGDVLVLDILGVDILGVEVPVEALPEEDRAVLEDIRPEAGQSYQAEGQILLFEVQRLRSVEQNPTRTVGSPQG